MRYDSTTHQRKCALMAAFFLVLNGWAITAQAQCDPDTTPPTFTGCPGNIGPLDMDAGQCTATASWTEPIPSDNCQLLAQTASAGGYDFTYQGTQGGHHYYLSTTALESPSSSNADQTATFAAAQAAAATLGGYLVTINDAAENTFIQNIALDISNGLIIGYTDNVTEGNFQWVGACCGGGGSGYTNWSSGQPDNDGGQDYTRVSTGGVWLDVDLVNTPKQFVVELNAPLNSPTGTYMASTHSPGDLFAEGSTTVTYTTTDLSGNTASCSFTVTVNPDAEVPAITCPANMTVGSDPGECSAHVSYEISATDNCSSLGQKNILFVSDYDTDAGIANILAGDGHNVTSVLNDYQSGGGNPTLSGDLSAYDAVYWSATGYFGFGDTHGNGVMNNLTNYVTNGGFVFVTGYDAIASPVDPNLINFLGGTGSYDYYAYSPTATTGANSLTEGVVDIVGVTPTGGYLDRDVLTGLQPGTTGVVATSGAGGQWQWTLRSLGQGQIAFVSNGTTSGTHSSWYDTSAGGAGAYNAALRNFAYHATGGFDLTSGIESGGLFPLGTTTNTLVVEDGAGNTASCSFTVTVNDTEGPTLACPPDTNVIATIIGGDCASLEAAVSWAAPTASDCTGVESIVGSHTSGATFTEATTVGYTATDVLGNTSSCSFTVTLLEGIPPSIAGCPENIGLFDMDDGQCGATASWTEPSASDNCGSATIAQADDTGLANGDVFPVGITTVVYVATDDAGNTASCSFEVELTANDTQAPEIICPANMTVGSDPGECGAYVDYQYSASDNCSSGGGNNILFVSDDDTDAGIANILAGDGHNVTSVLNDYQYGGGNPTLSGDLSTYAAVYWSATGYSGGGDTHGNGVMNNLTDYVTNGGFVFVTGYDAIASPTDPNLINFLGGTDSHDYPASPTSTTGANSLTEGVVDIVGVTPTGGSSDRDALTGLQPGITGVVASSGAGGEWQWTLRTLGQGQIAFVSNGAPSGTDPSWSDTSTGGAGAYNAALRNFAYHATGSLSLISGIESGDFLSLGTTTNTLVVEDGAGNTASCSFTITVNDTEGPALVCPTDVEVIPTVTDVDCSILEATVTWADPTASDCTGVESIVGSHSSGATFTEETTVSYTATDVLGNTSSCEFMVLFVDDFPPTFVDCPGDIVVNSGADCEATASWTPPTATDNCQLVALTTSAGGYDFTYQGTQGGHYYYSSTTALESPSSSNADQVATFAAAQAAAETLGGYLVTINDAAENTFIQGIAQSIGNGLIIGYTDNVTEGNFQWAGACCGGGGSGYTNWDAGEPDNSGGEDYTQISTGGVWVDVNLVDAPKPFLVELPAPPASGEVVVSTYFQPGDTFSAGSTLVTYLATDASGNTASCTFNVVVESSPAVTCQVPFDCNSNLYHIIDSELHVLDIENNTFEPIGMALEGASAVNAAGYNVEDGFAYGLVQYDNNPSNILVRLDAAGTWTVLGPVFGLPVRSWYVGDFDDNGNLYVYNNAAPPVFYKIDVSTMSATQLPLSGSVNLADFSYNPNDGLFYGVLNGSAELVTFNPVSGSLDTYPISGPINSFYSAGFGATWMIADESFYVFENNSGEILRITGIPEGGPYASYEVLNIGFPAPKNDGLNCVGADPFDCVAEDTENPTINNCPSNIGPLVMDAGQCGATAIWTQLTASDNCSGVSIVQSDATGLASGDLFPEGATTIEYTATDAAGFTAVCSFSVTVSPDAENPAIAGCPSNIEPLAMDAGQCGATATWNEPTAGDNCAGASIARSDATGLSSGDLFPEGATTIQYTATDAAGFTAVCSFSVTVSPDAQNPTINNCPSNIGPLVMDAGQCGATAIWTQLTASDNCSDVSIARSDATGLASGDLFPQGTTTIEYTATDAEGNTALCSFSVTVSPDAQNPSIPNCPSNIEPLDMDAGACSATATWAEPSASDNCSGASIARSDATGLANGDLFPQGVTTIEYTATDAEGNTAICSFSITVNPDAKSPSIPDCPSNIGPLDMDAGQCGATATWNEPSASDNCTGASIARSDATGLANGDLFPQGVTTIEYTATDAEGNTAICSFSVTVNPDAESPAIAGCPGNIGPLDMDAGQCGATAIWTQLTASDNCSGVSIVQSDATGLANGSLFPEGATTVEYTATDAAGNTAVCSFTVTVNPDAKSPTITDCPSNIEPLAMDAGACGATATWTEPTASDNCTGASIARSDATGLESGDLFPEGVTTIEYTATDAAGNTALCSFSVTVSPDDQNPMIICPENITVSSNPGICEASANTSLPIVSDNCGYTLSINSPTAIDLPGSFLDVFAENGGLDRPSNLTFGPDGNLYLPSWATDEILRYDGNTGVFMDVFASGGGLDRPVCLTFGPDGNLYVGVRFPTNQILRYDGNTGAFIDVFASGGGLDLPEDLDFGPDGNLYVASDLSHKVLRYDGSTGAFIDVFASGAELNRTGSLVFDSDGNLYVSSFSPSQKQVLHYDGNTGVFIDVFVEGAAGDLAFGPDGNLYVTGEENQVLRYDGNTGVFLDVFASGGGLDGPSGLTFGADGNLYVSSWFSSQVLRYAGYSNSFPIGINTIDYIATDHAGNTASCSFTVTVNDTENPTIPDCPTNIGPLAMDAGACGATATWNEPSASDNCTGASIARSDASGLASGDLFPEWVTTIEYTATDAAGNTANCSFTITVSPDAESPAIAGCPGNIGPLAMDAGACGATATWNEPTAGDNCEGASIAQTDATGLANGDLFPQGVTTIEYTATDAAGNTALCPFSVTVSPDAESPAIAGCPSNIGPLDMDAGQCGATATWSEPSAGDNCSGASIARSDASGLANGDLFPQGVTTIEYTATDAAGNTALCSFSVTVSPDAESPAIAGCPSNIGPLAMDAGQCGATATWNEPTASDNCSGASIARSDATDLASGDLFPQGATTIQYTATDAEGNTALCSFSVTVSPDAQSPTITGCPSNIEPLAMDAGACGATATWTEPTASDNCEGASIARSDATGLANGDLFPQGVTTIEYTATDAAGNTALCSFSVTVSPDAESPAIAGCPSNIGPLAMDAGACGATATWNEPTASDNCAGASIARSDATGLANGDLFPQGVTTIEYTATDAAGNTALCSFSVTVSPDAENPVISNCPANIASCNNKPTWVLPTASDNCIGVSLVSSVGPGTTFPIGTSTVTYTATDAAGNTAQCSFDVTVSQLMVTIQSSDHNGFGISCLGGSDGAATALAADGVEPYAYLWSNGETTSETSGLGAGTYQLTVTDANGCTATGLVSLQSPPAISCHASGNNPNCADGGDGELTATASGGVGGFSYNWNGPGGNFAGQTVASMTDGTYNLTVTDANGCTCTDAHTITRPEPLGSPQLLGGANNFEGGDAGSPYQYNTHQIMIGGGTQPYGFEWDNSGYVRFSILNDPGSDSTIVNIIYVDGANWSLTVTDANGCDSGPDGPLVFDNASGGENTILDIESYNITPDSGGGTGTVDITPTGGDTGCGAYQYDWSSTLDPAFSETTEDISGLPSGWYVVVITDCSGDTTLGTYWVPQSSGGSTAGGYTRNKVAFGGHVNLGISPNPATSRTTVSFGSMEAGDFSLEMFAVDGSKVATLFDGHAEAGLTYSFDLDASGLPAGVYVCRLTGGGGVVVHEKMSVVK